MSRSNRDRAVERVVEVVALFEDAVQEVRHLRAAPAAPRAPTAPESAEYVLLPGLLGPDAHRLVRARPLDDGGFELHVAAGLQAELTRGGVTVALEPGVHALPADARARVRAGELTWLISLVTLERRTVPPPAFDLRAHAYTAATAAVAGALLLGLFAVPPDPKSLSLDAFLENTRYARLVLQPPQPEEPKLPDWLQQKQEAGGGPAQPGARARGAGGKQGKTDGPRADKRTAVRGPENNRDLRVARAIAFQRAIDSGVLGVLRAESGSHIAAIWSTDDSALGSDATDALGHLQATEVGAADGVDGALGVLGKGPGADGTSQTIGADLRGLTKSALGPSAKGGYRIGGRLPGRGPSHGIEPIMSTPHVVGSLDKELVRRVIHQHRNEVRFCYEKALMKKPELFGRVVTQFTIDGQGRVLASVVQASTLGDPPVGSCIAQAVKRWEFPRPEAGGLVQVSYPFLLKSAAGE